ncbi:MAG: TIGR03619 family F420-dependent LLM class oxidoreductase [Rhodospirillaceae bacterium]|nr:MAG: TIGR03619 family F420-dependent LLM class oxidoreductase [Rhodospirillaceae bacterium]
MPAMPSKYGLFTPVVTLMPGAHGAWEKDATIADIGAVARAADRLGYNYLTCSEHIGIPSEQALRRGARYYDPLSVFGYLSAITTNIRFATYVLVLGYSHPLEIAKRYGTLDVVSGGRLVLGVGVGSLKPEFDLLGLGGSEFEQRGTRGDDALRALRASLGRHLPEYHGPHYTFKGLTLDPCATRQDVPLWIGGSSARSLRRAVELADGWAPFGGIDALAAMIAKAKEFPSWHERQKPLEIVLRNEQQLDPIDRPEQTAEEIRRIFRAGATLINVTLPSASCANYIEQLEALAALDV